MFFQARILQTHIIMLVEASTAISAAIGLLLLISEVLPFVKSHDYNGLVDFLVKKLSAPHVQEVVDDV